MTSPGHNSRKGGPLQTHKVKSYVERVKKLVEEQKAIGADISEVCKEAKDNDGLDPATLRFAARELLMDAAKRAERDDKREQYLDALGLAVAAVQSGEMSARQSAKIFNIGKSSIYKALAVHDVSTDHREMADGDLGEWLAPHDPVTGELIVEITPKAKPASVMPASEVWQGITAAREEHIARVKAERAAAIERRRAEHNERVRINAEIDADLLIPPPFLRAREKVRA